MYKYNIGSIKNHLKSGGVLVFPTDTCYGFSTYIDSDIGIKRIQEIKNRLINKPFSILFSSLDQVREYCYLDQKSENFILSHRSMSSFILKKKKKLNYYFPEFDTVSIRIENNDFEFKIVSDIGKPLVTTSVNISNEDVLNTKEDILYTFGKYSFIEFIFSDKFVSKKASTIFDLTGDEYKVIRN